MKGGEKVNGVFVASRLAKAKDVREHCERLRQSPALLLVLELEIKRKMYNDAVKRSDVAASGL